MKRKLHCGGKRFPVLAEEIGCAVAEVQKIKIHPTTGCYEVMLPNEEEWFIPFWLDILKVLPAAALVRFLDIHKDNIKYSEHCQEAARDLPEIPESALSPPDPPVQPEQCVLQQQSSTAESTSKCDANSTSESQQQSPRSGSLKEKKSISVNISNRAPVAVNPSISISESKDHSSVSGFVEPTISLAAAAVIRGVSAPPGPVEAAVGAIGAGVATLFGRWLE